jgi:hypothetical protein
MNPSRTELRLAALVCMLPFLLPAQVTNRTVRVFDAARVPRLSPVAVRPAVVTPTRETVVEFRLPAQLDRYNVIEQRGPTMQLATNVSAVGSDEVRAALSPGATLVFMEKEPAERAKPSDRTETKALFSTFLLRASTPRPGAPPRTVSGTLSLLANVPAPWIGESNAYVGQLSVVLLSDDEAAASALLPMTVELIGSNITRLSQRRVELSKPGIEGAQDVWVACDRYRSDAAIIAYYQNTNSACPLTLQRLTAWEMTQMILSLPMLFAGLVGGFMGGLLRLFKGTSWKPVRVARLLAEGVVVGVVTVTLLLSGLLHAQIAGLSTSPKVVLAFALAAVAGSVGAHFLDETVNRLRRPAAAPKSSTPELERSEKP